MKKNEIMKTLMLILFVFVVQNIFSQSVINTEKFQFLEQKKYITAIEISYDGTVGNANTQILNTNFLFGYKVKKKHIIRLMGGADFLSENTNIIQSEAYAQIRYNYVVSKYLRGFLFYQSQFNKVILLEDRNLIGTGLKFSFFNNDSSKVGLNIGLGAMYEDEHLNSELIGVEDIAHTQEFRFANFISFNWQIIKNISLNYIIYYQPAFKNINDIRVLNNLDIQFQISEIFSVQFSLNYLYDSKPPSTIIQHDANFTAGLVFVL